MKLKFRAPFGKVLVAAATTLIAAGCATGQSETGVGEGGAAEVVADEGATDEIRVAVTDMDYDPAEVVVDAGDTVIWEFDDGSIAHDVVGEGFESEIVDSGTFTHRFEDPGTYDYICTLHPNMTGTIEVRG